MNTVTQIRYLAFFIITILAGFTLPALQADTIGDEARLLITEVYYDTPAVDAEQEWLEIANFGDDPLQLDTFKIGDEELPGGGEGMVRFPSGATLQPQQVAVIAQSAVGFRALYGANPDYELQDSDPTVPDMLSYDSWAGGDIALNNDGDELLLLDGNDVVIDAVSYGNSNEFMDPSVPDVIRGQSIARIPSTCDTDTAADWQPQYAPTPGTLVSQGECVAQATDLETVVASIGAIQGALDSSPRRNDVVTFEGIVTGLAEDRNTRGAIFYSLFVQDAPGHEDGDPSTSDAIAVFHGPRRPQYVPGDLIRVTGQVTEYFGLTEIDDSGLRIELLDTEQPLPPVVPLELPDERVADYFESLEAMRVQLSEAVVVGPTFSGCGFSVVPGTAPRRYVRQALQDPVDGIVPVLHHSDVSCGAFPQVKVGDVVHGLQGPLTYHFEQFKIVHQFPEELQLTVAELPDPPLAPRLAANEASIASFNVHDHFDAIDDTGSDAEPKPPEEEVQVKELKLARTITEALGCPTLLAIQEVENAALLGSLARRLQPFCGFLYDVAHRESSDTRGIDLALMADPGRVQIEAAAAEQHCSPLTTDLPDVGIDCPAAQYPLFSRPPLEVEILLDGDPYTVIVTHFKSKREGEEETAARRLAQAGVVADLVLRRLQSNPDARIVMLGDFNDYEQSAPMTVLTEGRAGLLNTALQVPPQQRYTYNFGGVSQLLDAILISPVLAPQVVSSTILHLNSDFPAAWVNDEETIFRSSDHDIPFIILRTVDELRPEVTRVTPESTIATVAPTPTEAPPTPAPQTTANSNSRRDLTGALAILAIGTLIAGVLLYRRKRVGQ